MTGGVSNTVSVEFNNTGTVNANAGTLNFTGAYTQTSGATVLNGGGIGSGTLLKINGGTLSGTGTIAGGVSITSGAALSPGFTTGIINITGSYTQSATGLYLANIGGLAVGTQYDQVNLTAAGTAAPGGTLNASHLGSFVPATGNGFPILTPPPTPPSTNRTFPPP